MNQSHTILIVDDDPDDRELFTEAVIEVDKGLTCVEFHGALEILNGLKKDTSFLPGYIFLDMNMPLMNGKECLVELRKMAHLNSTRIVIYTTSQRADDVKQMLELGADAFLIKPSMFSHLKSAITSLVFNIPENITVEGLYLK